MMGLSRRPMEPCLSLSQVPVALSLPTISKSLRLARRVVSDDKQPAYRRRRFAMLIMKYPPKKVVMMG